jgi:imidazolonepropionase-like amidohydrolase
MLRRLTIIAGAIVGTILAALALASYLLWFFPLHNPHPAIRLGDETLAIRDATIYPSPDDPPILHASILIRNGYITDIGPNIAIPAGARILPCNNCFVTAGFWNAHVHFTEAKWSNAAWKSAAALNSQLADMLGSRGFTTVVDVGSDLRDTISLRRRIESGEILGPAIYTAGSPQYPPHGIPFYLRDTLPPFLLRLMPQPDTPAEAASIERTNIARGADVLKLFTGSYIAHDTVLPMPLANAQAAVQVAHDHHQLAFAHPSNLAGVTVARDAGVDVLAHAADTTEGITPGFIQSLVDRHMAMVPTLKMFGTTVTHNPAYLNPIYAEVREFHQRGGQLIFGTDVGYMTDYTTQDEFAALTQSGLTPQDILRMLTTAPATRFGIQNQKGRVAPNRLADLVILSADPYANPLNFAAVQTTIRSGRVIYNQQ